jgi:hypothetical protein
MNENGSFKYLIIQDGYHEDIVLSYLALDTTESIQYAIRQIIEQVNFINSKVEKSSIDYKQIKYLNRVQNLILLGRTSQIPKDLFDEYSERIDLPIKPDDSKKR